MSYAVIQRIESTSSGGKPVVFELLEKGGTTPAVVPKFMVYGYKLRFNFSDNTGLGFLNTELILDLVDDDSDSYYNLFNTSVRNDYGVSIKYDSKVIFWGFADFQNLTRRKFETTKKGIQIKFYTPPQFNKGIALYNTAVQNALATVNEGSVLGADFTRFVTFYKYVFADYLTQSLEIVARVDSLNGAGAGLNALADPALFNHTYFRRNAMLATRPNISLVEYASLICECFFMRWGYSFTNERPCLYSHHAGFRDLTQRVSHIKPEVINVDSGRAFINEVENTTVDLPELSVSKMSYPVISDDVNPLLSVTYNRLGVDHNPANPDFVLSSKSYTEENPNLLEPRFYNEVTGSTIPFDVYTSDFSLPESTQRVRKLSTGNVFSTIINRVNDNELSTIVFQDLTRNVAQSLMRFREKPRDNDKFAYNGILDPMRNHKTDFNDNIYVLVQGEWDLFNDVTQVTRSISFPRLIA